MNGVATITAHNGGRADAALVQRFRQSQTTRERTAVFADVVRQHGHAVLCSCARRLWPDADAAIAAAAGVLVAARLAMADPARRPRSDRWRDWLLAVAAQTGPTPGQPARIDHVDWEAVRARLAAGRELPDSPATLATLASLRSWLERIVATLPEPRQRMYDLCVTRGLDSRSAARELGSTVAEVRRLRRENRQAILRAFEVTALAAEAGQAADAAGDPPSVEAPGCGELRQLLAEARNDERDPQVDRRGQAVVLSAALRLTLSRHLSECRACQRRRDDCMARWAPELLPILAGAELQEQVMNDLQSVARLRQPGAVAGAHRRVAPAGPARKIVVGRPALAAAGGGALAALLLAAFVWPGVLRGTPAATDAFSPGRANAVTSGADAPTATGTVSGVPGGKHGRPARPRAAGVLGALPPTASQSPAASSSASVRPSVYYTVPPATAPPSSPTPSSPSPSPSSAPTRSTSPTPTASASTPTPSPSASTPTPTPSASTQTPTPTPSASTATPTPTTSAATPTPTPSASSTDTAEPSPTASASASSPISAAPTASSSTAAPSASATT
jgi:hypothetical protein